MFIVIEIDKEWHVEFSKGELYVRISLGFVAFTLWRVPFCEWIEVFKSKESEEE